MTDPLIFVYGIALQTFTEIPYFGVPWNLSNSYDGTVFAKNS